MSDKVVSVVTPELILWLHLQREPEENWLKIQTPAYHVCFV